MIDAADALWLLGHKIRLGMDVCVCVCVPMIVWTCVRSGVCWQDVWQTVLWSALKEMFLRGRCWVTVSGCGAFWMPINPWHTTFLLPDWFNHHISLTSLTQGAGWHTDRQTESTEGQATFPRLSLSISPLCLVSPSHPFLLFTLHHSFLSSLLKAYSCLSCSPYFSFSPLCSDYSDQNNFISISALFSRDSDITYQLATNRDERIQ